MKIGYEEMEMKLFVQIIHMTLCSGCCKTRGVGLILGPLFPLS
jgi:hypothetical protein